MVWLVTVVTKGSMGYTSVFTYSIYIYVIDYPTLTIMKNTGTLDIRDIEFYTSEFCTLVFYNTPDNWVTNTMTVLCNI